MIPYHGGPITPNPTGLAVWNARHAMISYARTDQMALAVEVCQSFAIDNGAYSVWLNGGTLNVEEYTSFVDQWRRHPSFDWAIIPDVIEGTEEENDALIELVQHTGWQCDWVPVWHLHESLDRLRRLVRYWPRVALGSSGDWSDPGTPAWWHRMSEAMEVCCDKDGHPRTRLHGLRMMDPTIFSHIPFSSVDSTAVVRGAGRDMKWGGRYQPLTQSCKAMVLVDRIEHHATAKRWTGSMGVQKNLELVG